ncbi:MAG: indolepyruvate ferredoxin oxidoreductase subunit alpha [Candidatus Omnitrophica bacterium]|nr:indolepyruvate ferredoxin oxidoreductase subunit alpha [Candidatus Omnitrophota bacterium]
MQVKYLLGNEAIAYGLYEGGIDASFAYPGTPSSEITEYLISIANDDVYIEWSINEKVAFENAYGVSLTGRRSCAIMKHVGLNVASDALLTSAYTGIIGGLVIVVADDPFSHSSQNEQDSRRYVSFARIVCFEPSTIQEAKDLASFSFEFSEKYKIPVILRSVTRLSHGKSDVLIGERGKRKNLSLNFIKNPEQLVMVPTNVRKAIKKLNEKIELIKKDIEKLKINRIEKGEGKIGIIASGLGYIYTKEFMDIKNKNYPVFKVSTYPIPEKKLGKFLKELKKVYIFEEGDPVIEEFVYICSKKYNPDLKICGKLSGDVKKEGELSVEEIEVSLTKKQKKFFAFSLPQRNPLLCPGCPHLGSFYILKKVFGKDAIYPGDIGCYTLGVRFGTIDTCLCMGSGISIGSGIAKFEKKYVISIIGDSTFFHAGIPGLINSVYNKSNQIIAILDNRTTAMTGYQPHPGTGITAKEEKTIEINLKKLIEGCGVENVIEIDPYKIKKSIKEIEKFKEKRGVKVIIFKRECIQISNKEKKIYYIDKNICKKCKLCLELNCPAIIQNKEILEINILCNGCGMCKEICFFDAIKEK